MRTRRRALLLDLYRRAVAAAHPATCLVHHLPDPPAGGRIIVIAAGKAAGAMAVAAEAHYQAAGALGRLDGFATVPYGYRATLPALPAAIEVVESRHPTPDAMSAAAADRALALAAGAQAGDEVLVLLSGGASALWAAPPAGIDLAAKTALTRGLLKCGADIHEMNTVRRHLSRIKGGRLAMAAKGARLLTLAISDVPGDDPATIGSGPTVADPTTLADARAVLARRRPAMRALDLDVPASIDAALADPRNETAKPGDAAFARAAYRVIATPRLALDAAVAEARRQGYETIDLGDRVTGEAREVAGVHARAARSAKARGQRVAIISGGELNVTVRNRAGRGGRSQEYALALALAIGAERGIAGLAADTDGIDGGEGRTSDPAGAIIDDTTLERAAAAGLNLARALEGNDATPLFEALGDLVAIGPTHTNVNDFRVILIDPAER